MFNATFTPTQAAWLALAWILYFVVHSVLADDRVREGVRRRWPRIGRYYRLLYTLQALVLILPALYLQWIWYGSPLWTWEGWAGWLADGLALAALLGFVLATRAYDMAAFLGLRTDVPSGNVTGFHISPLHRHVRHPWYFFGLILLWTRDMTPSLLVSAVCITAYLVVGSRLEERKLITEFGERYRRYQRAVPGLIPIPGRSLSKTQAQRLADDASK